MKRRVGIGYAAVLLLMGAFRWLPGFAAAWQRMVALPALTLAHRLTAALPFPLIEPLALLAAGLCAGRPLRRGAVAALWILAMYGLLWFPAYFAAPPEPPPAPAPEALRALCDSLTDALNASPLQFGDPLPLAGDAAGLPWARVKAVRYPEWMRATGIAGLFSPWTGEALVDGDAPRCCLPFTCLHELSHLKGVADEGAANIDAYRASLDRGGMFADSARLWALNNALRMLDAADPAAARQAAARAKPALAALLSPARAPRPAGFIARLLGLGRAAASYDALVDWLAGEL